MIACLIALFVLNILSVYASPVCSGQPIKIALMGDSLMRRSFAYYDLANLILQELRDIRSDLVYNIEYNCFAIDGSKIAQIIQNQLWPAIEYQPNATIIFWDTDISDTDEFYASAAQVAQIRDDFEVAVGTAVSTILNHTNSTNLALSIPGILGEDQIFKPDKFWHKVPMLNTYVNIVANICSQYNISYINMREVYLKNIPVFKGTFPGLAFTRNFIKARYFVTMDGEHPNWTGASRDANQFAQTIYNWFYANCSSALLL